MIGGSIDGNIYCVNVFELQMAVFYFDAKRYFFFLNLSWIWEPNLGVPKIRTPASNQL